ncbi:elongation of very long chain fatty acids protein 4-like [Musca vetustissima]|uniref:elongation of very long chain fatty acids protein 4-like n=1 Tax=Musca vetustissima TaxID=27455 RepID=UPI002AB64D83|nr:elongation of very long chain fatty acids protein 4-like [Musca vetustissima]
MALAYVVRMNENASAQKACKSDPTDGLRRRFKPLKLQGLLIVYNLSMALLNLHILKELVESSSQLKYSYWCQPCRVNYSANEIKLASAVWWFYFSKLLEFSDTAFFILRHKWKQLTPLHIYHHSTMFPLWWIAIKWVPTGSTFFPAIINSFVHVIMYTYYGLSACGPAIQKYLWWKKYLTALQLLQFTIGLLWAVQALIKQCDFPRWISWTTIIYMISFLILFGRFYKREYTRSHQKTKQKLN